MQQFVVPQFIDVEDKIFGPITTRQFIILLVSGLIFLAYRLADLALFITITVIVSIITALFAFYTPNGQAFHLFFINIIATMKRPSLRIWHKDYSKKDLEYFRTADMQEDVSEAMQKKTVRKKHIRDLSLVVNTGGYYRPEDHM